MHGGKKNLQPVVNEVCSARRRSAHYGAYRGTKPQESIDYLFDMLLKPGGSEKRGQGQREKLASTLTNG